MGTESEERTQLYFANIIALERSSSYFLEQRATDKSVGGGKVGLARD